MAEESRARDELILKMVNVVTSRFDCRNGERVLVDTEGMETELRTLLDTDRGTLAAKDRGRASEVVGTLGHSENLRIASVIRSAHETLLRFRQTLAERWLDLENEDPAEVTDETLLKRIEDLVGEGWHYAGKESERAEKLEGALRDIVELFAREPYQGLRYKIKCGACEGSGEQSARNHDDPKWGPCDTCKGTGLKPDAIKALGNARAVLEGDTELVTVEKLTGMVGRGAMRSTSAPWANADDDTAGWSRRCDSCDYELAIPKDEACPRCGSGRRRKMPEDGVLTPFDTVSANREAWKDRAEKLEGALREIAEMRSPECVIARAVLADGDSKRTLKATGDESLEVVNSGAEDWISEDASDARQIAPIVVREIARLIRAGKYEAAAATCDEFVRAADEEAQRDQTYGDWRDNPGNYGE